MGKIRQSGMALALAAALASPAALAGGGHIYIGGGDHHLRYGISIPLHGGGYGGYYGGPRHHGYRDYYYGYHDAPRHYRRPPGHEHCYRDHGHIRCYRHRH